MSVKHLSKFTKFTLAALCLALPAFAQKTPSPGTHITVSKAAGEGMYTFIQDAVNAARPGQVIEILDESVYEEQVTIDGREDHPWGSKVIGGKDGITLRYVATSSNVALRPTIKHQDRVNVSPKNYEESQKQGDAVGFSGNFETNGALRIIRTNGIKIEGIRVNGGGSFPIMNPGIWEQKWPLAHGNAAIAVAVSGNVQIRDCVLDSAFFGIAVKDRNVGGVFGNPNPADNDKTIPLSGFGKTGNHLFEYNRIHSNIVGVYFESSWDLGSTVRYNLIYHNYWRGAEQSEGSKAQDWLAAGIKFKDCYLSPVAIYNNTFFENDKNIGAGWQTGAQHLVFNNIFSRNKLSATSTNQFAQPNPGTTLDGYFPNRMFNSLFSATQDIQIQKQGQSQQNCTLNFDTTWITDVTFRDNMPKPQHDAYTHRVEFTCNYGQGDQPQNPYTLNMPGPRPGNLMLSSQQGGAPQPGGTTFPAAANIRWLETAGVTLSNGQTGQNAATLTLPNLFKSTDPSSADFLAPRYDDANAQVRDLVNKYIKDAGWKGDDAVGAILDEDGTVADIGAIPYSGKRPCDNRTKISRARVSPFSVVSISNTNKRSATASIIVDEEIGSGITGLKIAYIRWVAPLPDSSGDIAMTARIIPASAIQPVTGGTISTGSNKVTFTLPRDVTDKDKYGFFEIILHGTVGGKTVSTDVGFMPYRQLDYILEITVVGHTGTGKPVVNAGEPVTIRVRAMDKSGATIKPYTDGVGNRPLQVEYSLISAPTSRIWQQINPEPGNPLVTEPDLRNPGRTQYDKTYQTLYFTKAGEEVVSGAGQWCDRDCAAKDALILPFLGDLELIVKPGPPDKVTFLQPIPKSQIPPGGNAPTISGTAAVEVQVQDKYDNAVNTSIPVSIVSSAPTIGDVDKPSASTDPADGIARFTATVTNGKTGEVFDLTASIASGSKKTDVASLRVGRATDVLWVLYQDNGKRGNESGTVLKGGWWKDDYFDKGEIEALVRTKQPVWVMLASGLGDTVVTKNVSICVQSTDGLLFSATEDGTAAAGPVIFPMSGGVANFWVTSDAAVENASISVSAKTSADCGAATDNSVRDGSRGGITFFESEGNVRDAVVKAESNGNARPDYVEIYFNDDGYGGSFRGSGEGLETWEVPTQVTLRWPVTGECDAAASADGAVSVVGPTTIGVTFPASAGFPAGHSSVAGLGTGLLTVYNAIKPNSGADSYITLLDGIGPVISSWTDEVCVGSVRGPSFPENNNKLLTLKISESLKDTMMLSGKSLLRSSDAGATHDTLTVTRVEFSSGEYTLTLSNELNGGDLIKLNPSHGILDAGGNPVRADNRWVEIRKQELPPEILDAWYVTRDETGKFDMAYIVFNKKVTSVQEWFYNGSFTFDVGSGMSETFGPISDAAAFTILGDTLAVDLKIAFKKAIDDTSFIRTSGNIGIEIKYNGDRGWGIGNKSARDKARPVLISAVLQIGSVGEPDILTIVYSESLQDNISAIANPVSIISKDNPTGAGEPLSLKMVGVPTPSGSGIAVRYEVSDSTLMTRAGDWIKINEAAGVSDNYSNVQENPNNRRVALKVEAGKIEWQTTVKNNPFREKTTVVIAPASKGGGEEFTAEIRMYDNMGKVVVKRSVSKKIVAGKLPQGVDEWVWDGSALEWRWDGRNDQGRYVGTGTYLFKVVCKTDSGETYAPPPKKLAFVRGWGNK